MIYQYVVTLKNENNKYVDFISLLLCIISALFFLREQIVTSQKTIVYLIGFLFIAAVIVWNIYQVRKKKKSRVYYNRALFFAAIVWTTMPYFQWLVFVFGALGLLEFQVKFPFEIGFSNEKIVFNTFFKRKFKWSDFNNIILKDNLLTLDFKTNKVFQRETIDEDGEADEEEFNEYCRRQLITR